MIGCFVSVQRQQEFGFFFAQIGVRRVGLRRMRAIRTIFNKIHLKQQEFTPLFVISFSEREKARMSPTWTCLWLLVLEETGHCPRVGLQAVLEVTDGEKSFLVAAARRSHLLTVWAQFGRRACWTTVFQEMIASWAIRIATKKPKLLNFGWMPI